LIVDCVRGRRLDDDSLSWVVAVALVSFAFDG
jgi:hypothetical protein